MCYSVHFLLTNLLLDAMKKTYHETQREGRIVIVSSDGHRHTYREGVRFDRINDREGCVSIFLFLILKFIRIFMIPFSRLLLFACLILVYLHYEICEAQQINCCMLVII